MLAIVTSVVCLYIFVQTHRLKADRGVQRTLRFSITSRPLINVKCGSHMKEQPVITQKLRNDRVDQYFGRKWSKCRDVISDQSLGNTMVAIGGRALAPVFCTPCNMASLTLERPIVIHIPFMSRITQLTSSN